MTFAQEGTKLTGGGEAGSAEFGGSTALSADGNTALVSGPQDNSARGAVWAFVNPPPTVTTGAASSVGTSTATLNGTVGIGPSSTAHFQYGTTTAYGSSTAGQALGGGGGGTPIPPGGHPIASTISGLAPSTTYHFRIVAENSGGVSVGADQTFSTSNFIACPAIGGSENCAEAKIQFARPTVAGVSESHRVWREGTRPAVFALLASVARKRVPVGTTFFFTLNEPAKVSFAFTQSARGRKVAGRCVGQTNKNRRKHTCKRTVAKGALAFTGPFGRNRVSFQGVISRSKKLRPGSYTLVITASAAGLASTPARLSFTIVK